MPSALRQALLQPFTAWLTYVPLALLIPPPIFLAHLQLGELYMFWLHTEIVPKLGPLEYILNTPSHHRVHHGRNPKYIDKNYGGVFIFWDFLFGTFEPEDPQEPAVYGLVHPVASYNPFYLQFHHFGAILAKMATIAGWRNKLLTPIMGPGWNPGKPRLGHYHEIPKIEYPVVLYDPRMTILEKVYILWHLPIIIVFYHELTLRHAILTQFTVTCGIIALLFSITSVGFIMEKRWFAPIVELTRCLAFFAVEQFLVPVMDSTEYFGSYRLMVLRTLRLTYLISATICAIVSLHTISVQLTAYVKEKKHQRGAKWASPGKPIKAH
ncbi:Alkylglycerol monooxygenase [Halotydeus destructor]|nr:Alkylglycerol monooxygenase [Halotydeus destructor]